MKMAFLTDALRYLVNEKMGYTAKKTALGDRLCKYADVYTTSGGAAAEAVTITGIDTADVALVTLADNGTNNVTLTTAEITAANTLTITFSGDPSSDAVVYIAIFEDTSA